MRKTEKKGNQVSFLEVGLGDQQNPMLFPLLEINPHRYTFKSQDIYYTLYNILDYWCKNNNNISEKIEQRESREPQQAPDNELTDNTLSLIGRAKRLASKSIERVKKNYKYYTPDKTPKNFSLDDENLSETENNQKTWKKGYFGNKKNNFQEGVLLGESNLN